MQGRPLLALLPAGPGPCSRAGARSRLSGTPSASGAASSLPCPSVMIGLRSPKSQIHTVSVASDTLTLTHTHTHTHAHTHRPPEAQREPSWEHCHVARTTSHFVSDVPVTTPGAACALSAVKGSPGSLGIRGGGLMMSAPTLNRTGRVRGRSDSSCSDPATRDVLVSSGHRHE